MSLFVRVQIANPEPPPIHEGCPGHENVVNRLWRFYQHYHEPPPAYRREKPTLAAVVLFAIV
jgi:hypothetical protein